MFDSILKSASNLTGESLLVFLLVVTFLTAFYFAMKSNAENVFKREQALKEDFKNDLAEFKKDRDTLFDIQNERITSLERKVDNLTNKNEQLTMANTELKVQIASLQK